MAFKDPYMIHNFIGSFANGVAASAWVVANVWDGGLGTPQEDQWYYDTTAKTFFIWTGAGWVALPLVDGSIQFTGIMAYDAPGKPFANPAEIVDKQYVDAAISGLSLKDCVRVSTTAHVVLANQFAGAIIDGVALVEGDRFLVRAQNPIDADENGVYITQAAPIAPVRATDCAAGVQASGAWVIATEGSGTNADKGWLCTTDGAVFGDALTFVVFPSFSGHYFGEEGVFVDWTYGVDGVTADGTPDNPYKTLAYACTRIVDPANVSEFCTPVVIHMGPGTYAGPVTLPQRLCLKICGDNVSLTGNINWPIDPRWWNTFALNAATNTPYVQIVRDHAMEGMGAASPVVGHPQACQLVSGTFAAYNSFEGTGFTVPDHVLIIDGFNRNAFNIYNQPATTAVLTDAPNSMLLYAKNSRTAGTCIIAGEINSDGAAAIKANEITVFAYNCNLKMYGTCAVGEIDHCSYEMDYRKGHTGAAYTYGRIQGTSIVGPMVNIRSSLQVLHDGSFMGYDPAALAPTHASARAIVFDRESLLQMADTTTNMLASFYGFDTVGGQTAAYGRGWYHSYEEALSNSGRLMIPNGGSQGGAYRLFEHTYMYAADWLPNSAVLSRFNRVTIELESGTYLFEANFSADQEFVDIIGIGSSGVLTGANDVYDPSVVFYLNTYRFSWDATEASMQNILMLQHALILTTKECMFVTVEAATSSFKNLVFAKTATSAGTVWAVVLDPLLVGTAVKASWEDCRTKLDGFLYGGDINPTICARCKAGDYSFGGWHEVGSPLNMDVEGTFVDCEAGSYSFAATDVGGSVRFMGVATRCYATSMAFGHTSGGAGGPAYTGECGGVASSVLTDCRIVGSGNSKSFGYSETGAGTASAQFFRCSAGFQSFGCSAAIAAHGIFSGTAEGCVVSYQCFGANPTTPTEAEFTSAAIAVDCWASYQSFGARGSFAGKAYGCRATYGSFGWAAAYTSSVIDGCQITQIKDDANQGPPGVWGALIRDSMLLVKNGDDIAPLILTGGLEGPGEETRVFSTDLFTDTHVTSIDTDALGFYDAQIAHCRMNVDIDGVHVTNVIAVPYNVVDAKYDPR